MGKNESRLGIRWPDEEERRLVWQAAEEQARREGAGVKASTVIRRVLLSWARGELVPAGASPRKRGRKEET